MIPSLLLHFAGIFLSYSLQIGVAYASCILLSRLLRRPQQRFLLWLTFLLGAGTYWLGLVWSEVRALNLAPAGSAGAPAGGAAGWLHPVLIPATSIHALSSQWTQSGTGTVLTCPPLPLRSTNAQCPSCCWM